MGSNRRRVEARGKARRFGIEFGRFATGPLNGITDVEGVRVGHVTLKRGSGMLTSGKGPVRTGVTAIIPHAGDLFNDRPSAGAFVLNGNGEFTGLAWLGESGCLEGPILLTNTLSVHAVADGAIGWMLDKYPLMGIDCDTYVPVVGECDDSTLNDIRGRHIKERHVRKALDGAHSGEVAEGAVGAGTGMICYRFKGGIGSSSRRLPDDMGGYTVGVLVNSNHGARHQLKVNGASVGVHLTELVSTSFKDGSICIVIATDAPLSSLQLERLCKRAMLGLARTGATAQNGSGDFAVAFSNGRRVRRDSDSQVINLPELNLSNIDPLFEATADATEEAVINSLFQATTVVGRDNNTAYALPIQRCMEIMQHYGV